MPVKWRLAEESNESASANRRCLPYARYSQTMVLVCVG
jgi:hypothetical protein